MAMTASPASNAGSARLEDVLSAFERSWRSASSVGPASTAVPRSEDWLPRLDPGRPDEATELIYLEYCLAAELDPSPPDREGFLDRFPLHRRALSRLLDLHDLAEDSGWVPTASTIDRLGGRDDPVDLPEPGDEIGPYYLIRELGRGSFARVFLAAQEDLDRRLVVVKVSTRPSPEARLLARASHAHIVEVFHRTTAEVGDDRPPLQLVCMPFLGGATLASVLASGEVPPRSGRDLLARLDRASAPEYPRADVPRPAREILARLSHPKAVAYLFARLAEALDHAHRRGVSHGDIKPSNILLTADGLPMLFDFNLAVDGLDPDSPGGGTLAYMPPERLRALATGPVDGVPPPSADDRHRSDLYSLGLVIVEALTGVSPSVPDPQPGRKPTSSRTTAATLADAWSGGTSAFSDWDRLPIPGGLRPTLAACLAADPTHRHPDGRSLSADLDRWRKDLPSAFAPEPPWQCRIVRWIRRSRIPVAAAILTLVGASVAGTVLSSAFRTTRREEAAANYARFLDKSDLSLFSFREAGAWSPPGDPIEVALRKLNAFGVVDNPAWRDRDDVRSLDRDDRDDLELILLEQVYRLARAWADRPNSRDDWSRSLALLDRESGQARVEAFDPLRSELRDRLGRTPPVPIDGRPISACADSFLSGVVAETSYARVALDRFREASRLNPSLIWPRYRSAAAAFRLGIYGEAVESLEFASNRRPENSGIFHCLAIARFRSHRFSAALEACERARELDSESLEVYRTLAHIDESLDRSADRKQVQDRLAVLARNRGRAEVAKLRLSTFAEKKELDEIEDQASRESARRILTADPSNPNAILAESRHLRRAGRTDEAIARLGAFLEDNPENIGVRYIRAYYLRELHRPEVVSEWQKLIDSPRFEEHFRVDPDAIRIFSYLAEARRCESRFDEASRLATRGVSLAEGRPKIQAEAWLILARIRLDLAEQDREKLELARSALYRAIGLDPSLRDKTLRDPHLVALFEEAITPPSKPGDMSADSPRK